MLHARGIFFPRIHGLVELVALLAPPEPRLNALNVQLEGLSSYAVDVRYPGVSVTPTEAAHGVALAEQLRLICLDLLGIEP